MKNLKILIVDDEAFARQKLKRFLSEQEGIEEIKEAEDGLIAVEVIQDNSFDLVFLDIQMPGMTGFEVIEKIGIENMPAVVFVTAYDVYAIEAFKVNAIDYLLKPFDKKRFQETFQRALKQIKLKGGFQSIFSNLLAEVSRPKTEFLERVLVNVGSRYFFISTKDILFISAEDKYLKLHTKDHTYLIRETLNNMEQQLSPTHFARIHRSHIIQLDFIKEMHPRSHGDYNIVLKNDEKLILSRRYRENVFGR